MRLFLLGVNVVKKYKIYGTLSKNSILVLITLPVLCAILSLSLGRIMLPVTDILKSLGKLLGLDLEIQKQTFLVVTSIRLPRILLAILAGCGLSVSGCVFQSLFSNPLATPDTLGVASGSAFGAALGILFGFNLIGIQITALIFGLLAICFSWLAGGKKSIGMSVFVLSGIMIGSLFSGLISLVKYTADTESELPAITYWLMGSLDGANYKSLLLGAPIIIIGTIIVFSLRWRLNLLPLSEEEAQTSGVNMKKLRIITVLCASAITASCVSMCGQVGWVGLLVPHICRMKFGNNHLSLIPSSISLGAVFMLIVDTLARTISPSEIPVSVLTAIIGAPFFIFLMRKGKGWQL